MLRITLLLLWILCGSSIAAEPTKPERHVVVVVWDGMRPDFVSKENTPTLWKLASEGVTFRNHHAVYPSATTVNGTALVTGVYPGRTGIIANHVYRPDIDPRAAIDVELPSVVKKGDELSGGKYISVPTIPELVRDAGGRTAIASAKTVSLLLDRHAGHAGQLIDANRAASPLVEGERMKVRGSATPTTKAPATLSLPSLKPTPLPSLALARPSLPQGERRERRMNSAKAGGSETTAAGNGVTLFGGKAIPQDVLGSIVAALGPFPSDHLQQNAWTTKALTDFLWKEGVPALSILWLGEPDLTQHESAPGAPAALSAIKSSDENLAGVLSELDRKGVRETTDIFVVSDHGFSTIRRSVNLRKILNDAGLAAKTEFTDEPKRGDIMLVGNGGSVLFYIEGHDPDVTRRLVEFLQQSDFAGVILTKKPMQGTFGLEQAVINPPEADHAPDVVMAFRWSDSKNQFGVPGMIDADWQRPAGEGTHVTLSRFDIHNTLIAAGPDFHRGELDDLPSGNVDLAPTILRILGIKASQQLDGRILSEAITLSASLREPAAGRANIDLPALKTETKTIEAANNFPSGTWRQTLQISRVGSTIYLDQGNGAFSPNQRGGGLQSAASVPGKDRPLICSSRQVVADSL